MSTTLRTRAEEQFDAAGELRVLFFFDPEETFREEVDAWDHDRIRCVIAGTAPFRLKYRLEHELTDARVLLYAPYPRPTSASGYVLADLLAANRELRVDRVADFMEEVGLSERHRELVRRYYQGELEYKNRRQFLSSILTDGRFSEKALKRGLAAYHLDVGFRTVPRDEQLAAGLLVQAAQAPNASRRTARRVMPWS